MYSMMERKNAGNSMNLFATKRNTDIDSIKFNISVEMTETLISGVQGMTEAMTAIIVEGIMDGRRK